MLQKPTMHRAIRVAAAAALTLVVLIQAALALEVPPLRARVNDHAGMLSQGVVRQLDLLLKDLEQRDSTQIVVLTVPSLEGDALEDFSMRVAEQWKVGHKGLDNGAILLISRADRKVRIEVGYGLEGRLTDLQAGRIIRGIIVPEFKAGRFDQGVVNGVQAMIDVVRGEFKAEDKKDSGGFGSRDLTNAIPFLFLFVFLVFCAWAGESAAGDGGRRIFHAVPGPYGLFTRTGVPGCPGRHRPGCRIHPFGICRHRTRQWTSALRQAIRRRILHRRGRILGRRWFLRWRRRIRWRRSFRQLVDWGKMGNP